MTTIFNPIYVCVKSFSLPPRRCVSVDEQEKEQLWILKIGQERDMKCCVIVGGAGNWWRGECVEETLGKQHPIFFLKRKEEGNVKFCPKRTFQINAIFR